MASASPSAGSRCRSALAEDAAERTPSHHCRPGPIRRVPERKLRTPSPRSRGRHSGLDRSMG
ncbi:hypothetical protein ABTN34_18800, partial [Acinetobacter baumannii]